MAKRMNKVIKRLDQEIGRDFNQTVDQLLINLKRETPVATGTAQRGWRKTKRKAEFEEGPVIENRVPYIDILEQGHSDQAPRGIIGPAMKRTRRLK
jgi:hypothetical protein